MKGNCEVCLKFESKYKCPACYIQYCSLDCYKQHKEASCGENVSVAGSKKEVAVDKLSLERELPKIGNRIKNGKDDAIVDTDDEDWVSPEKLQLLGDSEELRNQLKNKHLRNLLVAIDSAPNPGEKLDQAMQIPIFTEFMDVCMKVIEDKEDNGF